MLKILEKLCVQFHIDWKFIKFCFVGIINTLFGYTIFSLCIFLNFHYTIAALISIILGTLFNFKTTGVIVFHNNNNRLLFKFITIYGIIYFLSITALKTFLLFGYSNMYLNSAILLGPNAVFSYLLFKYLVFNE